MAWAMKLNNGFGDYFPDGDFAEWKAQLRQFWYNGLSDQRRQIISDSMRSYSGWVSAAFEREIGVRWGGMQIVAPLDEELPKLFRTVKTYRNLASMISLNDRLIAVDEDLRAIIEDLEPGVHRETVPNFVPDAFSYVIGKRSSNMMASWLLTACHSRTERFHLVDVALSAR